MARVVLIGNLAQLTGGIAEFQLAVSSVKQLFDQLGALYPDARRHLDDGVAVAIDGQIYQDSLLEPIAPDSEVYPPPSDRGRRAGRLKRTAPGTAPPGTTPRRDSAPRDRLVIVFVVDGLRPDAITAADTPTLFRLRAEGMDFANSHAVFPTVTRVNAAAISTGTQPGTNGIVGNQMYVPAVDPRARVRHR